MNRLLPFFAKPTAACARVEPRWTLVESAVTAPRAFFPSPVRPGAADPGHFLCEDVEEAADLHYNRARYYDPTPGRWTSDEPSEATA